MDTKIRIFVGIDMSKSWFDAAVSKTANLSSMKHRRFDNDEAGFLAFEKWLRHIAPIQVGEAWVYSPKQTMVCMEHTGVYTLPLCHFLQSRHYPYSLVAGLQISKSIGIRRGKSDKSDAKAIARYACLFHKELRRSSLPTDALMQLRLLLGYRAQLKRYEHGLKVNAKELNQFVPKAQSGIVVEDSKELVAVLKAKMKTVEAQMEAVILADEQLKAIYELLISVKSVGLIIAATFLVYTNGFTAFKDARKFASYCGIAPFSQSSGSSMHKKARVSSMGYRKIKALLTNAAWNSVNFDKEIRAYWLRKREEGKEIGVVLNAIKFKIIARVFAVVKRGVPFVPLENYRAEISK